MGRTILGFGAEAIISLPDRCRRGSLTGRDSLDSVAFIFFSRERGACFWISRGTDRCFSWTFQLRRERGGYRTGATSCWLKLKTMIELQDFLSNDDELSNSTCFQSGGMDPSRLLYHGAWLLNRNSQWPVRNRSLSLSHKY